MTDKRGSSVINGSRYKQRPLKKPGTFILYEGKGRITLEASVKQQHPTDG